MAGRRAFLSVGCAAALAAGGTAWAVSQQGSDPRPVKLAPPIGILAHGTASTGERYTISRIDPGDVGQAPTEAFCTQISMPAAGSQGCDPLPDEDGRIYGQPWRPSFSLLGSVRFFSAIAPKGVTAMEVTVVGEAKASASRSLDAGSAGELLVVMVGGPQVTSRNPASSRDYNVRLLDENGDTVHEIAMSDPPLDNP